MTITIDKNVPLAPRTRKGPGSRYPFAQMQVGDSFAVPLCGETQQTRNGQYAADKAAMSVVNAALSYRKATGARFTTRTLKNEGVVRVWRVA